MTNIQYKTNPMLIFYKAIPAFHNAPNSELLKAHFDHPCNQNGTIEVCGLKKCVAKKNCQLISVVKVVHK